MDLLGRSDTKELNSVNIAMSVHHPVKYLYGIHGRDLAGLRVRITCFGVLIESASVACHAAFRR